MPYVMLCYGGDARSRICCQILAQVSLACVKIAKDMNFQFGTQDHRDSPDMTPGKNFGMVRGQGHVTPLIFGH